MHLCAKSATSAGNMDLGTTKHCGKLKHTNSIQSKSATTKNNHTNRMQTRAVSKKST